MLDTKKSTGMNSEYQSGWIFGLAIMNIAPRPDWCRIESVMPKITAASVRLERNLRNFSSFAHSAMTGENSTNMVSMYSRKCHATRNRTELYPYELPMIGL